MTTTPITKEPLPQEDIAQAGLLTAVALCCAGFALLAQAIAWFAGEPRILALMGIAWASAFIAKIAEASLLRRAIGKLLPNQ